MTIVVTATPTHFAVDGSLDRGAGREHLQWLANAGVDAIFPAGTTGEFPTIDDAERLAVLEDALSVFEADRTFFHVGAASAHQGAQLVAEAVARGATRLAAVTPFYQPAPEAQVVEYYARLVEAAGDAQVHAYLFEARTSTPSEPRVLQRLADVGVVGVKLSGESDESVAAYIEARPEGFTIYSGNDVSFGWLGSVGGDGIVSGVSSVYPEPFVALRDALRDDDQEAVAHHQAAVETAVAVVSGGSLSHLKEGARVRGFGHGVVRSAVAPVNEADRATMVRLASTFTATAAR